MSIKSLWEKAKKEHPPHIKDNEIFTIAIAAAVGAAASYLLTQINFNQVNSLTGIPLIDLIIYAVMLTFIIAYGIKWVFELDTLKERIYSMIGIWWKQRKEREEENSKQ